MLFQTAIIGDVSWFLVALILCYIVTRLIGKYNLYKILPIFSVISLILNLLIGELVPFFDIEVKWYWTSNFWLMGFPFFSIGLYLKWIKENKYNTLLKFNMKFLTFIFFLGSISIILERIFTSASQLFFGNILMVMAIFLFCLINPVFGNKVKVLCILGGSYSFGVYILHPIVRDLYDMVFISYFVTDWLKPIVVFMVSIFIYANFLSFKKLVYSRIKTVV